MYSMTGFGRYVLDFPEYSITVEINSVNHRYCDIAIHIPQPSRKMEEHLRRLIKEKVKRGKCTLSVSLDQEQRESSLSPNWPLIQQYIEGLGQISDRFHISNDWSITDLLALDNLFITTEPITNGNPLENRILETAEKAINDFLGMRLREGQALHKIIEQYCRNLGEYLLLIEDKAPEVKQVYKDKLSKTIEAFLHDHNTLDEDRLYMEAALFSDKCNIDEEIIRLKSHISQCSTLMNEQAPIGRKLDFLIQEMNREINTIGSKANDVLISQWVVEMKSELEKMREQVQNVE